MWSMLCDTNVLFSMYTLSLLKKKNMPVLCFTINNMKPPVSVSWICEYLNENLFYFMIAFEERIA